MVTFHVSLFTEKKDYINKIKIRMGACASGIEKRPSRELPLIFKCQKSVTELNQALQHEFQFQLSNVAVLPVTNTEIELVFAVKDVIEVPLLQQNLKINKTQKNQNDDSPRYEVKWNQTSKTHFTMTETQLSQRYLTVSLGLGSKKSIEIIRLSLFLIANGPYHHSIQINYEGQIFRVLFDSKISHLFEAHLEVAQLQLKTHALFSTPECHFTLRALHHQQVLVDSEPSYSIKHQNNVQMDLNGSAKFFQQQCPNSKIRKNGILGGLSDQNLDPVFSWKPRNSKNQKLMPVLTADISTQEITHHSIQIIVWSSKQSSNTAQYVCQTRVPLWKLLQRQFTQTKMPLQSKSNESSVVFIEQRKIRLNEKLYSHHNIIGNCEMVIIMKNEKMIEQTKYCSRTQNGIVNLSPTALNKDIKSNSKTIYQLWKQIEEIDTIVKGISKNGSLDGLKSQIAFKLIKINDKLCMSRNQLLYFDNNKYESLINNQKILITVIQKLFPFIQTNEIPTLFDLSWSIVQNILKRTEFNLQNLSLKGTYTTPEAKSVLSKKTDVGLKYQHVINKLIKFAVDSFDDSYGDHQICCKFLAFCFFRVVKFRERFFQAIKTNEEDAIMEKRLQQFQNQIEPKTSFNDHFFKMKVDWQKYFYQQLSKRLESEKQDQQLMKQLKDKRFFVFLSVRDEVFNQVVSQILRSLPKMQTGGPQKWKGIDGYCKLVGLLLSEISQKSIQNFMGGLIRSSILLLNNEHLINIMMPLICEKVNANSFQKVQMVMDLLTQFLQVITKKRTQLLPLTFNNNYFFEIIKIILEGEHFYNINRILILIYNFFPLFSQIGKYQIAMYLMGKPFFKLFYHWSKDVRNTFANLLIIRFKSGKGQKQSEISHRCNKVIAMTQIIANIYQKKIYQNNYSQQKILFKKLKNKIYDKRKNYQNSQFSSSRSQLCLQNLMQLLQEDTYMPVQSYFPTCNDLGSPPVDNGYLPSFNSQFVLPLQRKKRTYSQNYAACEDFSYSSPVAQRHQRNIDQIPELITNKKSDNSHDYSGRKKRKPSLFLPSKSVGSTKQYTSTIVNQLHFLSELQNEQIKNIMRSKIQFCQIDEQIQKYAQTHGGDYPERNFLQNNRKQMQA